MRRSHFIRIRPQDSLTGAMTYFCHSGTKAKPALKPTYGQMLIRKQ